MQLGEVGLLHLNLRELHLPQGSVISNSLSVLLFGDSSWICCHRDLKFLCQCMLFECHCGCDSCLSLLVIIVKV